jgi:hypothetical protein
MSTPTTAFAPRLCALSVISRIAASRAAMSSPS